VASAAVRECAIAFTLDALAKFTWDSDELPYFDDMWFALRVCTSAQASAQYCQHSTAICSTFMISEALRLRSNQGFFENHPEMFFE
ncbi:hypothetical protein MPER_16308, partial [Moniliophthora perniciosa FA553]